MKTLTPSNETKVSPHYSVLVLMRKPWVHGQFPYREIYNVAPAGTPAYQSMLYYDQLRYRLLPYLYSLAGQVNYQSGTLMRGLVMDFPQDSAVDSLGDEYLFGPSLLVAPVTDYQARTKSVYLPAGTGWYDFYSGRHYAGSQRQTLDAPLERLPLLVRAGSIVPFGPALQYTTEKPADPLTLYVYTGQNADFTLYEDEGTNYNYEKGAASTIALHYDEATRTLRIGARQGSFPGMLAQRTFRVVWVSPTKATAFDLEAEPAATVPYAGQAVAVRGPRAD